MSRARGLCGRCGGPRRGRSARRSDPVADCEACRTPVCARHAGFDPEANQTLCTSCARDRGVAVLKVVR